MDQQNESCCLVSARDEVSAFYPQRPGFDPRLCWDLCNLFGHFILLRSDKSDRCLPGANLCLTKSSVQGELMTFIHL